MNGKRLGALTEDACTPWYTATVSAAAADAVPRASATATVALAMILSTVFALLISGAIYAAAGATLGGIAAVVQEEQPA
jgi:hypothetical protein